LNNPERSTPKEEKLIGIVPAAGIASRLGNLPFSKELLPLNFEGGQVKVVSSYLLETMFLAGVCQIHVVLRKGKWDIPEYFGSEFREETAIAYHIARYSYGVPFTVNQVYPFIRDKNVLFGFPDILFKPTEVFISLKEKLEESDAPLVLGLLPVSRPDKFDMVEVNDNGILERIVIKPKEGESGLAWSMAAWKPEFTEFLNNFIHKALRTKSDQQLTNSEFHFGDVIISAMEAGMKVEGVAFEKGISIDLGTPEDFIVHRDFLTNTGL
jgi:glucose-1-phosphate thymidylyltransferase